MAEHLDWTAFASRHAGHRDLARETIYALEADVIDAIEVWVPRFFSKQEASFERDLSGTAGLGFFLKRPMGQGLGGERPGAPAEGARQRRNRCEIERLLEQDLNLSGVASADVRESFERARRQSAIIARRSDAYAAWLLANSTFQKELDAFRKAWGRAIRRRGAFPCLVTDWLSSRLARARRSRFEQEGFNFFARWGLTTMASWDWPVPVDPVVDRPPYVDLGRLRTHGLSVYLPWHMVRGDQLNLHDYLRNARTVSAPDHLREWIEKSGPKSGRIDEIGLSQMRWVHRCHRLVLQARYQEQSAGRLGEIDLALSTVIKQDEETIRKSRLRMNRLIPIARTK